MLALTDYICLQKIAVKGINYRVISVLFCSHSPTTRGLNVFYIKNITAVLVLVLDEATYTI